MNTFTLWENDDFEVVTPKNPHQPYAEGLHVIVSPKKSIEGAWDDSELAAQAFKLAVEACSIMKKHKFAPWFNIQANGNWGLLPGNKPFFHVHILGRNRTTTWGKPIVLPEAPGTYSNEPMPEKDRKALITAFKQM